MFLNLQNHGFDQCVMHIVRSLSAYYFRATIILPAWIVIGIGCKFNIACSTVIMANTLHPLLEIGTRARPVASRCPDKRRSQFTIECKQTVHADCVNAGGWLNLNKQACLSAVCCLPVILFDLFASNFKLPNPVTQQCTTSCLRDPRLFSPSFVMHSTYQNLQL